MKDSSRAKQLLTRGKDAFLRFWGRNFGLKVLSLVLALLLWSYVIATNPDITRDKIISDVAPTITGQTVLENSRGLALLTSLQDIPLARVRVRVAQASVNQVTPENVRVELDLSGIRQTGKQSVKLRGATTYGSVVEIVPEYVELEVENRDQRYVPVNVLLSGEKSEGYWYSVTRVNPSQVTVSGPTSQVQTISSARISLDMTDITETHSSVENLVLLDAQGADVPWDLTMSSSSATVTVEAYPTKTLPIAQEVASLVTGQIPDGYQVDSVEVSPAQLSVAADEALLDSLEEISIEPVSISGARRTFTATARVRQLSEFKNLSAQSVSVTVNISEQTLTRGFSNVTVHLTGEAALTQAHAVTGRVSVRVEGPYSAVRSLTRDDIQVVADLAGRGEGTYVLPLAVTIDNYPDLTASTTPDEVTVQVRAENISG